MAGPLAHHEGIVAFSQTTEAPTINADPLARLTA